MKQSRAPADLKAAGKTLWRSLTRRYYAEGCEALLGELCRIWDRLSEVRERLAADGLTVEQGRGIRKHPLVDSETKLSAAFVKAWKTLGLDREATPPKGRGRPGGT